MRWSLRPARVRNNLDKAVASHGGRMKSPDRKTPSLVTPRESNVVRGRLLREGRIESPTVNENRTTPTRSSSSVGIRSGRSDGDACDAPKPTFLPLRRSSRDQHPPPLAPLVGSIRQGCVSGGFPVLQWLAKIGPGVACSAAGGNVSGCRQARTNASIRQPRR